MFTIVKTLLSSPVIISQQLYSNQILLHQEVDKIAATLSELAKVVAQEKQLLQEFYDLFQAIYVFEVTNFEEKSSTFIKV